MIETNALPLRQTTTCAIGQKWKRNLLSITAVADAAAANKLVIRDAPVLGSLMLSVLSIFLFSVVDNFWFHAIYARRAGLSIVPVVPWEGPSADRVPPDQLPIFTRCFDV